MPLIRIEIAMAQTKHQIQSLLAEAGAPPRRRFGQNFMIDPNLVRRVAEAGRIEPRDCVLEIGPGTATLTEELLQRAGRVVAVEIDHKLAALLRRRLGQNPNFTLIEGDALAGKHRLDPRLLQAIRQARYEHRPLKLVANLPYNIASPLVIELLLAGTELLAFTVQKEVADRLRATANTDDYGSLSVIVQMMASVQLLRTLPPQAFWPAPKVESALVRLVRNDRLGDGARRFSQFVSALFAARRKTIRKALSQMDIDPEPVLGDLGIDPRLRPEALMPELLLALFRRAGFTEKRMTKDLR